MIFISRDKISRPVVYDSEKVALAQKRLQEFYSRSSESRSQERYQRPFAMEISKEIKAALNVLFNNKCAYCESLLQPATSGDIDHFRPKSGARGLDSDFSNDHYWWLTYEWQNTYLTCQVCNRFKSTWFPVDGNRCLIGEPYEDILAKEAPFLIDPCNVLPEKHLLFKLDGKVDYLSQSGRITVELLKLNREELVNARMESLKEEFSTWEEFLVRWRKQKDNWKRIQEICIGWESIFNGYSKLSYLAARRQLLLERFENHPEISNFFHKQLYKGTLETRTLVFENLTVSDRIEIKKSQKELNRTERLHLESLIDLTKLKHVYLEKIELQNFKCFSNIEIAFNETLPKKISDIELEDSPLNEPWLLFLGENGVGKSSILKAISIALMSARYRNANENYISPEVLLKRGTDSGHIRLFLKGEETPIEVTFNSSSNKLTCSHSHPITNLIAYGSVRLLPNKKIEPERIEQEVIKVANLFDYTVALEDADKWLLGLEDEKFDAAALTLKDLMSLEPDDKLHRNEEEKSIFVLSQDGSTVPLGHLSDGYKSVYALAVDIMSTLSNEKASYDVCEAIVLIDEIGTHLHPRWKMAVVSQLRKAFPKIQFIVTTHEPLCLRGLHGGETVVLSKNAEEFVVAITDLPDPSDLRVDQILTSEFFGLRSTLDIKTEAIFNEYYDILAKEEINRSEDEKSRLLELNAIIPKIKHLGDTLREDLVYYVIDELLAKKVKEDGYKFKEELQAEALLRVKSLWESIDNDKRGKI